MTSTNKILLEKERLITARIETLLKRIDKILVPFDEIYGKFFAKRHF